MKNTHVFPVLLLFSLILFACQVPTAVEIRGTPEFRFAANMNIGSIFTQELEGGFESASSTIIPCVNTTILTFIVHEDLFNEAIDIGEPPEGSQFLLPEHWGVELTSDKDLINPSDPIEIPLSGLGNRLEGFTFHNAEPMLFVSGSPAVSELCLGIKINGGTEQRIDIPGPVSSDRDKWGNEYTWEAAPPGGRPIAMPLDGSDVSVEYRVYAEAGTTLSADAFHGAYIIVELVIWLPLEFIAVSDGAEIAFPMGSFFGENDLFGRDSPDSDNFALEIIESLSADIKLDTNPFLGKKLVISSGDNIEIKKTIDGNSLNFVFNEGTMTLINDPDNWPFVPGFKIVFEKGDTLKLPKRFNATEMVFTAGISYRLDFGDSSPLAEAF